MQIAPSKIWKAVRQQVSLRRVVGVAAAAAAIIGAILLAEALGGGASPARIVGPADTGEAGSKAVQIGRLAPNFEARDLDGKLVRLSDFRGQPVMVNFWAKWCTSCRAEIPVLQRVLEERKDNGLVVIGVDWGEGSVEGARNYMRDLGATYPVVMDPDGRIGDAYRVSGLPVTVAIDKQGVVRDYVAGELDYDEFRELAELIMGPSGSAG